MNLKNSGMKKGQRDSNYNSFSFNYNSPQFKLFTLTL